MRAPSLPAPGSCRGQSSAGPFPDQLSFEFRQSREEREDQLSAGRRRVDAGPLAGEHPDPDVPVVEVLHQVDEMAEIATEAIEPPDDDHVSLPRRLEEGGEPRAVLTLSGRLVLVDRVVADAGLAQSIPLQFAPRIRDLGAQRLYRLDAPPRKEGVAVLLKGLVRSKTLLDNWDELLRVAGSLKLGWVTASLLISKLQAGARENVFARALRDLGRLVKTEFILRWIENQDYRRRIHRQLNKGEALHALRRFLFFAHEGKVQRRQADQQTNQILCLNLVTNAIVTWNTVYMNAAIDRLRAKRRIGRDIDLGHLSPALYGHVNPYGKYRFEIEARAPGLRPLRSPGNDA